MTVSRETLAALAERHGLGDDVVGRLAALAAEHRLEAGALERLVVLLTALGDEPDPPTTVRDFRAALDVHVADSLSGLTVEPLAAAARIADLGAGAGFPGLALAIALPRAHVDLIESAGRKAAVIEHLARAAQVENAAAVVARAEEWARTPAPVGGGRESYAAVTARALAPLAVLAEYAAPLLQPDGVLVAWKGVRDPDEERAGEAAAERLGMRVEAVRRVVPFAGAEHRHLHVLRKIAPTPAGFPRRPGMARKRPLA